MNRIIIFILLPLTVLNIVSGQTVSIETDKNEYKLDEEIEITIAIDFAEDSVKLPEFERLEIESGPLTQKSVSTTDGVTRQSKTWTYKLKPKNSGDVKIESPVFFVNGKEIKGKINAIKILDSLLTEEEQRELRFGKFVEAYSKPEGTYRYVLNEEFGFIEIYRNLKWEFYRRLTKEEMELLRKIK